MIKTLKIELLYFTAILVVLTFLQHPDLLTSPLERLELIIKNENFLHPFLWSFGVYLILLALRFFIKGVVWIKNRFKK